MIREVPFCPYLDSPPDFSFGENGENCLDGAITVTGHVCVTYYRENERGVKKKVNIPWSWCDIIRALSEVFSSLVLMVLP